MADIMCQKIIALEIKVSVDVLVKIDKLMKNNPFWY